MLVLTLTFKQRDLGDVKYREIALVSYTKWSPQTSSTNDTRDLGRNAHSLATPKPTKSEVGRGRDPPISV